MLIAHLFPDSFSPSSVATIGSATVDHGIEPVTPTDDIDFAMHSVGLIRADRAPRAMIVLRLPAAVAASLHARYRVAISQAQLLRRQITNRTTFHE